MQTRMPVFLALAIVSAASRIPAAEPAATTRVVRCTFAPVPKEYRAVAVFDALSIGKDGSVYLGTSNYGTPALLMRYTPADGKVVAVCDVSTASGENPDTIIPSGKIHSQLPVASDGKVYFGSHLGDDRCMTGEHPAPYGGGHFLVYDPATGMTEDLGQAFYSDSAMRVELDEARHKLYGVTYPSGHLIVKDLAGGAITDKGQASHHGYAMPLLFADGRAYFFSRPGHIARYDPDADRIEEVLKVPPAPNGGKIEDDWFYYTSMIRGRSADLREVVGSLKAGKARYLYRFCLSSWRKDACGFDWLSEVPLDASGLVRAPDNSIYLYAWNSNRIYYYDARKKQTLLLGIPRDAAGYSARIFWPAVFAPDGTLYIGGVLDTPNDRFKSSGYGYGALGFFRITPQALQDALRVARAE